MGQQLPCCMGHEAGKTHLWPYCLGNQKRSAGGWHVHTVGGCRSGPRRPFGRGVLLLVSTGMRRRKKLPGYHCLGSFGHAGFSLFLMSDLAKLLLGARHPRKSLPLY